MSLEEKLINEGKAPPAPAQSWAILREKLQDVAEDPGEYGHPKSWSETLWWVCREMDESESS